MNCKYCKKAVNEATKLYYSGKKLTFCSEECFQSYLESSKEEMARRKVYKLICDIFSIEQLDGKLLSQLKNIRKEGLSYNRIAAVLHYMYEIKCIKVTTPTLFYVKDYIEEAKNYYQEIAEKESRAETLKNKQEEQMRHTTIIKPNYSNTKRKGKVLKIDPSQV